MKQTKKVPLNLKRMVKNQSNLSENEVFGFQDQGQELQIVENKSEIQEDHEIEFGEESPILLKCKERNDEYINKNVKNGLLTQSCLFQGQKQQNSTPNQNIDTQNQSKSEVYVPKQRFARRYFQQKEGQPSNVVNSRYVNQFDQNRQVVEQSGNPMRKSIRSHVNLNSQNEINLFKNDILANAVECSISYNNNGHKQKQNNQIKINPAYKLDERFLELMKSCKNNMKGENVDEKIIYQFKSQQSIEDNIPIQCKIKHLHKQYQVVSKTHNDLDKFRKNTFQRVPNQQEKIVESNELLSENEQQNLIQLYHQNIQSSMEDCLNSSQNINNINEIEAPAKLFQNNFMVLDNHAQNQNFADLKSKCFVQENIQPERQQSNENTKCSTPSQQIQENKDNDHLNNKDQENGTKILFEAKSETKIPQTQKIFQNSSIKSLGQKQYCVKFTDIQSIKNSTREYANLFKSQPIQHIPNNTIIKDSIEDSSKQQIEKSQNFRIRSNLKKDSTGFEDFQLVNTLSKSSKDIFSCSYQNIEKINQNEDNQEDFELFNYLSCNLIPEQVDSNCNLDQAFSDVQQKNFIVRKIKVEEAPPKSNNQLIYVNQYKYARSSSSQLNRNLLPKTFKINIKEKQN